VAVHTNVKRKYSIRRSSKYPSLKKREGNERGEARDKKNEMLQSTRIKEKERKGATTNNSKKKKDESGFADKRKRKIRC
jgi:hypothetical protein